MSLRVFSILTAGAILSLWLLWGTDLPFGIPGEWTWGRHSFAESTVRETVWGIGPAVVVLCGYLCLVRWIIPTTDEFATQRTAGKLCGLMFSGFAVAWMTQSATPSPYADLQRGWVAFDPAASGYFFEAVRSDNDAGKFLARYEAMMAGDYVPFGKKEKQRDVYHIGTHPPGLILMHRGLLSACRESPNLSGIVLATQPRSSSAVFLDFEKRTRMRRQRLTDAERAALWLSVLLTHLAAAATVVPLYYLVRGDFGSRAAWMTASFWPLVPAMVIFLPKSDALFPLLGLLFLWSWRSALRRRSWLLAVFSGGVMWLGLLLSLALLPVALFAVLLTCWETFGRVETASPARCWKHNAYLAFLALSVFVASSAVFFQATGANLPSIWLENFRNHAGFYAQESHVRTYGKWLLMNPLELAFAVGFPIFGLPAAQCIRTARTPDGWRFRDNGPVFCGVLVIGLLWLTGKNMGEAGRLWLFLMPWLLWMSAAAWRIPPIDSGPSKPTRSSFSIPTGWLGLLTLQAVVFLFTVIRVAGFQFGG